MKSDFRINFITDNDSSLGSTRIRIYNILDELKTYFLNVCVNGCIEDADIIVFQKTIKYETLLKAKRLNKFCIFDIDDLYPRFNDMVKFCDLVIVSTEYLKHELLRFNNNIIVIPNSLDIVDANIAVPPPINDNTSVCWFGWSNNDYILDKIGIRNCIQTISDKGDIVYDTKNIDKQLQCFKYCIVPQEKNSHTLAKTHCRMLKALYLGLYTFVSDMPEYIELARYLDLPKEYILADIYQFKDIVLDIKKGKNFPIIDFEKVRKLILERYDKKVIAKLFSEMLVSQYQIFSLSNTRQLFVDLERFVKSQNKRSILESIFSVKNTNTDKKRKVITILGFKISIKLS